MGKTTESSSFSVRVLISDKYTVFNFIHPIKGKCIVERSRGVKQKRRALVTKYKSPESHRAGEDRDQPSSLAPWERMEAVVPRWQGQVRPLEDGRELQAQPGEGLHR